MSSFDSIQSFKRYLFTVAHQVGVSSPPAEELKKLPMPAFSDLSAIFVSLFRLASTHHVDISALQDFLEHERQRLGKIIVASGVVVPGKFSKNAWAASALKADQKLNQLATLMHVEKMPASPAVDVHDKLILRALAARAPILITQYELEVESGVTRNTISKRYKTLFADGLICQPKGPKSGTALTPKGRALLQQIDGAKTGQ